MVPGQGQGIGNAFDLIPRLTPEGNSALRIVRDDAVAVENQDLLASSQSNQTRRAKAGLVRAPAPDKRAGLAVIGHERALLRASSTDHDQAVEDQRRTANAPRMGLRLVAGEDIPRPNQLPTVQLQAVEDASSAQRENPISSDGRSRARADASYGGLVAGRIGVLPELAARGQIVADDLLLGAVLLLSYGPATDNGKGGPRRTDGATPDFARRVLGPVAFEMDAAQAVVALGAEKLRPIAGVERGGVPSFNRGGVVLSTPTPFEDRDEVTAHTLNAKKSNTKRNDEDRTAEIAQPPAPSQPRRKEQPEQREENGEHEGRHGAHHLSLAMEGFGQPDPQEC